MIENNSLIAKFMGYIYLSDKDKMKFLNVNSLERLHKTKPEYVPIMKNDTSVMYQDSFEYDSSWDWLMPVVKKIRSTEKFNNVKIIPEGFGDEEMIAGLFTQDINKVYEGVIKFIKWYNENTDDLNENQILGQSTII